MIRNMDVLNGSRNKRIWSQAPLVLVASILLTSCAVEPNFNSNQSADKPNPTNSSSAPAEESEDSGSAQGEFSLEMVLSDSEIKVWVDYVEEYPLMSADFDLDLVSAVRLKAAIDNVCSEYDRGTEDKFLVATGVFGLVPTLPNFDPELNQLEMAYSLVDITVEYNCPEYSKFSEVGT